MAEIGAGKEVPRENNRLRGEEIARVINEVVLQEGQQTKRKARELSDKMQEEGNKEMDVVVQKVMENARGINT